jgi:hypothetical protein
MPTVVTSFAAGISSLIQNNSILTRIFGLKPLISGIICHDMVDQMT